MTFLISFLIGILIGLFGAWNYRNGLREGYRRGFVDACEQIEKGLNETFKTRSKDELQGSENKQDSDS